MWLLILDANETCPASRQQMRSKTIMRLHATDGTLETRKWRLGYVTQPLQSGASILPTQTVHDYKGNPS